MAKRKKAVKHYGFGALCILAGSGMLIFGLILWLTNSWAYAFIILGLISILKGLYLYSKGCW